MSGDAEPTGLRWWGWVLLAAGLLLAGFLLWLAFLKPDSDDRASAVDAACKDARALLGAGLLDEARTAYRAIAEEELRCSGGEAKVVRRAALAARSREQGDQYLRAARLTRKAERRAEARDAERTAEALEDARLIAIRRSMAGYRLSYRRDPHDPAAKKGLQTVISLMAVPADVKANARCFQARKLRHVHALEEAGMVYAQALRTGRTTRCLHHELGRARVDRGKARRLWREGEVLERSDDEKAGRAKYIEALALDPSLDAARKSLAASEAPDPRAGEVEGQLADAWQWIEGTVTTGDDFTEGLTKHDGAIAAAVALALLLALLAMYVLFLATRYPLGRQVVGAFRTPDFCRPKWLVSPFTPADKGDTSTAVFLHWLPIPGPDPRDAGDEPVRRSAMALEVWEEPKESVDDLAGLFTGQPGALAAAAAYAKRAVPRRETMIVGHALERCGHGPGLRVLVKTRGGDVKDHAFWWATSLPGPPLTAEADEAEARHALAIKAAAWARQAADVP